MVSWTSVVGWETVARTIIPPTATQTDVHVGPGVHEGTNTSSSILLWVTMGLPLWDSSLENVDWKQKDFVFNKCQLFTVPEEFAFVFMFVFVSASEKKGEKLG